MPIILPEGARKIHQGRLITSWEWEQKMFDGNMETFECVVRPDSVAVLPFLSRERVLVTKQEQPQRKDSFIDLPGGRVDDGENLETAAKRELLEETGHAATDLILWDMRKQGGLTRFESGFFLAKGLERIAEPHLDAGERIELVEMDWRELVELCLKGKLRSRDSMLLILQMEFDPENRKRLDDWLA